MTGFTALIVAVVCSAAAAVLVDADHLVSSRHQQITLSSSDNTLFVRPTAVDEERPMIVIRKGRYSIQPSWSSKAVVPEVAAFDYSGVTAVVSFTNTTRLGIMLYQAFNASNWQRSFNGTKTTGIPNVRFNATLHQLVTNSSDQWKIINFTIVDTLSQLNSTDADAPYHYQLFNKTSGLLPSNTYRVEVQKITEPNLGTYEPIPRFVELHQFVIMGIPLQFATLLPVKRVRDYTRRVEFIGDSITCGYCNLCKTTAPKTSGIDNETFALAWPNLACDALGADCHTISWSGIGVARDYGGRNISTRQKAVIHQDTMLELYNRTLATVPLPGESAASHDGSRTREPWSFNDTFSNHTVYPVGATFQSRWNHPQAVVINLGTNDFARNNFARNISHNYTESYVDLLSRIVDHYGASNVKIFLACGPMSTDYCGDLFNIIKIGKQLLHADLIFLDQRNILNDDNKCCGHPDLSAGAELARLTVATIEAEMGWY